MIQAKSYRLGPFIILTFIYFLVGFLTTINGQFQGPLKIAFLNDAGEMKNTFTTLISFFFFLGYLLNHKHINIDSDYHLLLIIIFHKSIYID